MVRSLTSGLHIAYNVLRVETNQKNQQVSVQNATTGLWSPATIIKSRDEPRSYIIETPEGTTLRRNRRYLKDSGRTRQLEPCIEPDIDDPGECNTEVNDPPTTPKTTPAPTRPPERCETSMAPPNTRGIKNGASQTRSGRKVNPPKRYDDFI
ncbi:hypothetical protein PoB_007436000 [Plakobranchus ocellatus]|uniref:Uncharacterized protein n=1 Tax=Plakobranchus ocellatus TaxID=259542 RepID=A0AAV4DV47_9GAST|nr:hypothetical protein PoB_007436000 [Plakobranchus ocellatus]